MTRPVRGLAALRALEQPWWQLWHADPHATPFQSPAWLLPWAESFQPGTCFALVDARSPPAFLFPLFSLDAGRHLLPLGAGTSDWLGPVGTIPPDLPWPAEAALIDLPGLPATSPLLNRPPSPGWRVEGGAGEPCPALDLPTRLAKSLRQSLRTAAHRMDRLGTWKIVAIQERHIPAALDRLFALHAARWQAKGEPGVLADPAVRAFHHRAAPRLDAAGLLRFYGLACAGDWVALLYGLSAKGRFHHYIGGYDPALAAASPGSLLLAHALDRATEEGCILFDFLRGREPYKYRWGARDRPCLWRRWRR